MTSLSVGGRKRMATPGRLDESVQKRPADREVGSTLNTFMQRFFKDADECPRYWSPARDNWLREFVTLPGNDLLQGTISTITGKIATTGWYVEGPEKTATRYRDVLAERSEFGAGWSVFIQKVVKDYLTQDKGAFIERIRTGGGASIGFAHLDSDRIRIKGNPEYPAVYRDEGDEKEGEKGHPLHHSQIIRIVDSPSPKETHYNIGFCAVSRALMTARILSDIGRYERERLSDLPPQGILFINNMSRGQWEDIEERYETQQQQQGNKVWRDILVAFGLDPSLPLDAELFEFSQLPEHFDKQVTTEIAVYSFALAFRIDPREIWPVSAGPLGTATEAEIQHLKARSKGSGLILTDLERAFNQDLSLPASLNFRFDYQDVEEDESYAELRWRNARFLRELWAPPEGTMGEGEGIISREEARRWLVKEGIFEADDLLVEEENKRKEDVPENQKSWAVDLGPKVRAFQDGKVVRLSGGPQLWRGVKSMPEREEEPITTDAVAEAIAKFEEEQGGVELG